MKNLLVIIGTVLLGVFILHLLAGDEPDSLKTTVKVLMEENFAAYME